MPIVLAEPRHIPAAVRLCIACMKAMRAAGIEQWDETYPNQESVARDVRDRSLFVLEEPDSLLAAICLDEEQHETYKTVTWSFPEPALVVHRLCVDPTRQRTGLGHHMMDFAEQHARRCGYSGIRLDTYSGNPTALRLYESRGYHKKGEVRFRGRPLPFFCFDKSLNTPQHP